jgi:hypothetical protein
MGAIATTATLSHLGPVTLRMYMDICFLRKYYKQSIIISNREKTLNISFIVPMGKIKKEKVMQGVHDWLDLDELPLLMLGCVALSS